MAVTVGAAGPETRRSGLVIWFSSDPNVAGTEGLALAAAVGKATGSGKLVVVAGCIACFTVFEIDVVRDIDGFGVEFKVKEMGGLALLGRSAASILR